MWDVFFNKMWIVSTGEGNIHCLPNLSPLVSLWEITASSCFNFTFADDTRYNLQYISINQRIWRKHLRCRQNGHDYKGINILSNFVHSPVMELTYAFLMTSYRMLYIFPQSVNTFLFPSRNYWTILFRAINPNQPVIDMHRGVFGLWVSCVM